MEDLFNDENFKKYGNLDSRIHWKIIKKLESKLLGSLRLTPKFKNLSERNLKRIIWFCWDGYIQGRQGFNDCAYETVTSSQCMISDHIEDNNDYSDTPISDFVFYFKDQLNLGTISIEDQVNLFDVDFDLRFFRGFESLENKTRKQLLALKLAIQEPRKTLTAQGFKSLVSKENKTTKELEVIQMNIDFYWSEVPYDQLKEIYNLCKESEDIYLDLKISRQLDETLWFAESIGLSAEHTEVFLSVLFRLERLYRGKIRRSEFSRYAFSSDNPEEAHFNHFLRGIDLVLGMSDRIKNLKEKKENETYADIKGFSSSSESILELILTVLLHDSLEDKLKTLDGEEFDIEMLDKILTESGVSPEIKNRLKHRTILMNSKSSLEDEPQDLTYAGYLQRLKEKGDPMLIFVKIIGDFSQNLCSVHRNVYKDSTKKDLSKRYKEKFKATENFIASYIEGAVFSYFPPDIKSKMRSNVHLSRFFSKFRKLFRQIDSDLHKLSSSVRDHLDQILEESLERTNSDLVAPE